MAAKSSLSLYRQLLRTSRQTFANDTEALVAAKEKISAEFRKHRDVGDAAVIYELQGVGKDVMKMLQVNVRQAKLNESSGNYRVSLTQKNQLDDDSANLHINVNAQTKKS
eukprot:m.88249 g.88249  ORF g.88249 m.88249 type:complete len:110 (+) comp26171_c0_seq1:54-383(+)